MGQSQDRADGAVCDSREPGRGLVHGAVLHAVLSRAHAERGTGDDELADAAHHARLDPALSVLRLAVGPYRPQARDAARPRHGDGRFHPRLPDADGGGQSRPRPCHGQRAGRRRGGSRRLLAAIRSDRQGEIRHRLRHRQERADQCRHRLHQPGRARGHADRNPHRPCGGAEHQRQGPVDGRAQGRAQSLRCPPQSGADAGRLSARAPRPGRSTR